LKGSQFMGNIFLIVVLILSAFYVQAYASEINADTSRPLADRLLASTIPTTLAIAAVILTLVLIYKASKG